MKPPKFSVTNGATTEGASSSPATGEPAGHIRGTAATKSIGHDVKFVETGQASFKSNLEIRPTLKDTFRDGSNPREHLEAFPYHNLTTSKRNHPQMQYSQTNKPEYARILVALARSPYFEYLSLDSRDRLAAASKIQRFRNGHVVHRRDRYVEGLYVILSGALRVAWRSPSGAIVPVAVLGEGNFYGIGAFVDGAFVETDCRALGETVVAYIDRSSIQKLIAAGNEIRTLVPNLVLKRLQSIISLYVDLVSLPFSQRLARRLLSQALSSGRKADSISEYELPTSQSDLAQMVGVSRSKLNAELRRLESERIIRLGYRRLFIRDFPRLHQLAGPNVQEL